MELLVVRHAIAEDRDAFARTGKEDSERPLTAQGRKKFEKGVRGLRRIVDSIDLVATSSLVRATQTARLVAEAYGTSPTIQLRELAPDADPSSIVGWLRGERRRSRVAIVGHEPHLSTAVEYLLTGGSSEFVELKKGGACLLELGTTPGRGRAKLRWLLTPAQLRRLGR